jgi:hypothetical protein
MRKVYIATNTDGLLGYYILGVFIDRNAAEQAIEGLELGGVESWDVTPMFVSNAEERRWQASKKVLPKAHRTSS